MKALKKVLLIISILILGTISTFWLNTQVQIKDIIHQKNGTYKNNVIVSFKNPLFKYNQDVWCILSNDSFKEEIKAENNVCTASLSPGTYTLSFKNKLGKILLTKKQKITVNNLSSFNITKDKIYLIAGDKKQIEYSADLEPITWEYDENIISVVGNEITALKDGKTTLKGKNRDGVTDQMEVTVTSLLNLKTAFNYNKSYISCKQYSTDEAKLLDEFLEYEINEAGYQTRAGVVAAARFLTLAFQYRLPYFFENGRLSGTGVHYIDGEGRYYHKGLYLSTDKYESIGPVMDGPAMWGCNLKNRDNTYGYKLFAPYPNGLDCSGFVTWAILNGGFDIGDIGSYDKPIYDSSQFYNDEFLPVTIETLNSGKVKPGDVIAVPGHLALIAGIDEEHYYVAESNIGFKGLVLNTYTKQQLTKKFTYIHLMDSIYKEDGNLTLMW
ncbi:MAG: hypothetical protein E7165_04555 [Firmicutes bacterium]|nr:hypothetical protein [Bacillota bacterium]